VTNNQITKAIAIANETTAKSVKSPFVQPAGKPIVKKSDNQSADRVKIPRSMKRRKGVAINKLI